jgi:hypothetical protein
VLNTERDLVIWFVNHRQWKTNCESRANGHRSENSPALD